MDYEEKDRLVRAITEAGRRPGVGEGFWSVPPLRSLSEPFTAFDVKRIVAWAETEDSDDEDNYGLEAVLELRDGRYAVLHHFNEGMTPGYPCVWHDATVHPTERDAVRFGLSDAGREACGLVAL